MEDWTHQLKRGQYELLIKGILRASTIATAIEEMADDLDAETIKQMAKAMRDRVMECLVLGGFDEEDVEDIRKGILASIYTRPDA